MKMKVKMKSPLTTAQMRKKLPTTAWMRSTSNQMKTALTKSTSNLIILAWMRNPMMTARMRSISGRRQMRSGLRRNMQAQHIIQRMRLKSKSYSLSKYI